MMYLGKRLLVVILLVIGLTACGNAPASENTLMTPTDTPPNEVIEPQPTSMLVDIPTPVPTSTPAPETTTVEPVATEIPAKTIRVGSRDFTEQLILGQILVKVLEDNGFTVEDSTGLGGTNSAHDALKAGEVDIIWDYIGTILSESHDVPPGSLPTDVETGLTMVSALDERHHNLVWMQPTLFNDTYTLMIKPGTIAEGLNSMEDLATFLNENDAPLTLCVENEFYSRGDGLTNLEAYYGFDFPEENIEIVAYEQLYTGLRDGLCDVAEGFSTDGRISAYGFQNLTDSLAFFPNYSASPIIRGELLVEYPELENILNRLGAELDDATMTELNARVDLGADGEGDTGDEETVADVALDFLESHGLLGDRPQIAVGSRDFTEQLILGEILIQVLKDAGFDVIDKTGLGGTNTAHNALTNGEVDVIWEYIGTVLSESHGVPPAGLPTNVIDGYDMVSALDKRHNRLVWLTPSLFNDTYTLMVKPGGQADGLASMSALAEFMAGGNADLRLCVENEFYSRGDGLTNLQAHYGFNFAEANIEIVAYENLYSGLRDGLCDVAEGFSTDGRIGAWGLKTLADDKQFFPTYNASPVMRQDVFEAYPEVADKLDVLGQFLDDRTMTLLNARVDIGADGVADSGDEESVEAVALSFLEQFALIGDRPQIAVGSRDFTEQLLMGYLSIVALEDAGFEVIDRTGLGGTNSTYEALLSGAVDVAWEYTGTSLSEFHNVPSGELPTDPIEAFDQVAVLDSEQGLTWLNPGTFNDTYTFMVREDLVNAGISTLEDLPTYLTENPDTKLCVENEFYSRGDGLFNLQEHYGFAFAESNIELVAYDQLYEGLREGLCDVAEGFSTDGRIDAYGFTNLADTLAFFPAYNAGPIVRQDILQAYPEVSEILGQIGAFLDNETITRLNRQVDIGADGERNSGDEESVRTVAEIFLCDVGLLRRCQSAPVVEIDSETAEAETNPNCQNVIRNGDFEELQAWGLAITGAPADYSSQQVHSGNWALRLGIPGREDIASHSAANQRLLIPEGAETANISFWYNPVASDVLGGDEQGLFIYDSTFSIIQQRYLWGVPQTSGWVQERYDLQRFIGEEIYLHFAVINDGDGLPSTTLLDDVVLEVCFASE